MIMDFSRKYGPKTELPESFTVDEVITGMTPFSKRCVCRPETGFSKPGANFIWKMSCPQWISQCAIFRSNNFCRKSFFRRPARREFFSLDRNGGLGSRHEPLDQFQQSGGKREPRAQFAQAGQLRIISTFGMQSITFTFKRAIYPILRIRFPKPPSRLFVLRLWHRRHNPCQLLRFQNSVGLPRCGMMWSTTVDGAGHSAHVGWDRRKSSRARCHFES